MSFKNSFAQGITTGAFGTAHIVIDPVAFPASIQFFTGLSGETAPGFISVGSSGTTSDITVSPPQGIPGLTPRVRIVSPAGDANAAYGIWQGHSVVIGGDATDATLEMTAGYNTPTTNQARVYVNNALTQAAMSANDATTTGSFWLKPASSSWNHNTTQAPTINLNGNSNMFIGYGATNQAALLITPSVGITAYGWNGSASRQNGRFLMRGVVAESTMTVAGSFTATTDASGQFTFLYSEPFPNATRGVMVLPAFDTSLTLSVSATFSDGATIKVHNPITGAGVPNFGPNAFTYIVVGA